MRKKVKVIFFSWSIILARLERMFFYFSFFIAWEKNEVEEFVFFAWLVVILFLYNCSPSLNYRKVLIFCTQKNVSFTKKWKHLCNIWIQSKAKADANNKIREVENWYEISNFFSKKTPWEIAKTPMFEQGF
jgi:hypothetical protein